MRCPPGAPPPPPLQVKAPNLTPAENNLSAMANRQIYCLGSIDVKFKLHARDPRKCTFAKSESYWSNKEVSMNRFAPKID